VAPANGQHRVGRGDHHQVADHAQARGDRHRHEFVGFVGIGAGQDPDRGGPHRERSMAGGAIDMPYDPSQLCQLEQRGLVN